ncbi:MAG TPA: helicase-related protein [Terriglobia bacterium]|nr:helicase-related protein [Terriglobia bacterium]
MTRLQDLRVGAILRGLIPGQAVTLRHVELHSDDVASVTYVDGEGKVEQALIYKDQEPQLELVQQSRPLSFEADGDLFRLVSEAQRLRYAFLFDPLIAVTTSAVDPLPHQITAVYETMLNRRPLRFLLADDPGAGKTIMAGLLIKELMIRGDIARCLIVAPGGLVEQWQDELDEKFSLAFDIMTNEGLQAARTGNWFQEHNLCIARLDKMSRNEDVQAKACAVDWDLIVVDESHKMSASYYGSEVKYTKRYKLGEALSKSTRQFLLLTATPHNGKDEDFHLFLKLLDGDRFEGRPRDGAHVADVSDVMRRMVKEQLVTMEGKPLFQERCAYTVDYTLSAEEAELYRHVTDYVREGFNNADKLNNEKRKGTVGFALTLLQRRLASSPEAIYQSLRRRLERLEDRLREEKLLRRGSASGSTRLAEAPELSEEDIEDLDEAPEAELEQAEEKIVDQSTASQTIAELEKEIAELRALSQEAARLRRSGKDQKWQQLSETLQVPKMFDANNNRKKLIIFSEHRDTLNYLCERLGDRLGNQNAVVTIHGGTPRERRRQIQEAFENDPEVLVLIATDAAGEGINLHRRAHLMVNYDLPWNPNRIEQRFGRIHRIGQREVCHLWNLVAHETREGEVWHRLLVKLQAQRDRLGGAVFDVLGQVFRDQPLKDLLIRAIRYGEQPEVKSKLEQIVDRELDIEKLRALIEDRSLVHEKLDSARVRSIRDEMERAQARRLQPHYIGSFFLRAFEQYGGSVHRREPFRYEIRNVPAMIRHRDRVIGMRAPVLKAYERVTFHKEYMRLEGKPPAALVAPGHPLLDSVVDLLLEQHRDLLRQGAALVDTNDSSTEPRVLFYLEHSITDARRDASGNPRVISRRLQFVEVSRDGRLVNAGFAPYLDYTPLNAEQKKLAEAVVRESWLGEGLEGRAAAHAIRTIVPEHLREVKTRREALIDKTLMQVKARLLAEIRYWDERANFLRAQEEAGRSKGGSLNSGNARRQADELSGRLQKREEELNRERQITARPPTVLGGALVIPAGWFAQAEAATAASVLRETPPANGATDAEVERLAMEAVMARERAEGFEPRDVCKENRGYDVESRYPASHAKAGQLRFIEVKGRVVGAPTVTVTKNEILTALNKPDDYILAIVFVGAQGAEAPRYLTKPFEQEPDFATASVTFRIRDLVEREEGTL